MEKYCEVPLYRAGWKTASPEISHSLNVMCDYYGISLDHHQAASESNACAEILMRYMKSGADVNSFIRTYRLT